MRSLVRCNLCLLTDFVGREVSGVDAIVLNDAHILYTPTGRACLNLDGATSDVSSVQLKRRKTVRQRVRLRLVSRRPRHRTCRHDDVSLVTSRKQSVQLLSVSISVGTAPTRYQRFYSNASSEVSVYIAEATNSDGKV